MTFAGKGERECCGEKFPRGICARGVKEKFTRVDSSSSLKCVFLGNSIMCFHSRGQHLCKFIGTKESVYIRKEFNSTGLVSDTNMAIVLLFWDTDMAAMTSWENTQFVVYASQTQNREE